MPYLIHMSTAFLESPFMSCVHCMAHGGGGEAETWLPLGVRVRVRGRGRVRG